MNELPPPLQQKRELEDRAASLGAQRHDQAARLQDNTHAMIDLARQAQGLLSTEHLASLLGVSRQTVYNWRELASAWPTGESAAQAAAKRTAQGHALHYKG